MRTLRRWFVALVGGGVFVASPAIAEPIDLTSGTSGRFDHSQSFNETRATDVTVLEPAGMTATALRLDGLQNGSACSTRVGARVYDSETQAIVATADAFVGVTDTVSIPVDAELLPAHRYRIGFFVETIPRSQGSGTLFEIAPPYVEAGGRFRVNQGHQIDEDAFPSQVSLAIPQTTIEADVGLRSDRPVAADVVLRRLRSGASRLELRSRDPRLPFPTAGGPDDPAHGAPGGLTLELFSRSEGDGAITVPADGGGTGAWRTSAHAYRYRNAGPPDGTAPVRAVVLRDAQRPLLKIVAQAIPLPMTVPQGALGVRVTMGRTRICARFDAAGLRRDESGRFVARATVTIASCNDVDVRPASRCGDGICQLDESCDRCVRDCGPCPGPAAPPFLPMALGLASFDAFIASGDCATLPSAAFVPDPARASCWASPFGGPLASADDLIALLPSRCCAGSVCGGGVEIEEPDRRLFELSTTTDSGATFLSVLQGCLTAAPPLTTFLVPTLGVPEECEQGYGYAQTLVPVVLKRVVPEGPDAGIEVEPYCGVGMCRFGFCAPGATCETCSWDCPGIP